MKIDRHSPRALANRVKPARPTVHTIARTPARTGRLAAPSRFDRPILARFVAVSLALLIASLLGALSVHAQQPSLPVSRSAAPQSIGPAQEQSDPRAAELLRRVLTNLVRGPSFHAKVRETIWTNGREVVGVGTYEQAGGASGRFNLQVTMHDGDGKHRLQQISDGRLAWTRTEIAGRVTLRRVDVGRLDEWVSKSLGDTAIAPRLTVGAWAELLTTIQRDHVLAVVGAKLEDEPVWVLTGRLKADRRAEILAESGRSQWPMLYPTRVHIAIRSKPDPVSGFGELLPIRFEFWSDPVASTESASQSENEAGGRLITLIELYSVQPITPPPAERFRFENQEAEVNFVNETDRYIELFGIHLTERELRQLRR